MMMRIAGSLPCSTVCKIKPGCQDAGKKGRAFVSLIVGQSWSVVLWDGDEDPSLCKSGCLLIEKQTFVEMPT